MAKNEMNDQLIVRRQKMEELRENGIEPFGQRKFDRQDLASGMPQCVLLHALLLAMVFWQMRTSLVIQALKKNA